jgi:hypothetical protein
MAVMVRMTEEDLDALRAAVATLEHPGLAARLGNIAGKPIELVGRALPEGGVRGGRRCHHQGALRGVRGRASHHGEGA